jgi:hypothetical protein
MATRYETPEGKRRFIEAFFDDLQSRINFTRELHKTGHRDEAVLLCGCYIDGLGNYLYSDSGTHEKFVRVVCEYGDAEFLTRIHIRQLRESLDKMSGKKAVAALRALDTAFPEVPNELLTEAQVLDPLKEMDDETRMWLTEQLWRGTLASVAYTRLRSPSVHELGAPGGIAFDDSRIDGDPVPTIDFDLLYSIACRVNAAARDMSLETEQFFGRW